MEMVNKYKMKTKNSVWYEYCIYAAICMDTHTHTHFFMWMIKYFTVYKKIPLVAIQAKYYNEKKYKQSSTVNIALNKF